MSRALLREQYLILQSLGIANPRKQLARLWAWLVSISLYTSFNYVPFLSIYVTYTVLLAYEIHMLEVGNSTLFLTFSV